MAIMSWVWIPITLVAAASQTVRNAAQRSLTKSAGTLAAAGVRFVYGLPFALLGLALAGAGVSGGIPVPNATFAAWVSLGAVAQLVGTACLLSAMEQRTFIVAVAYSKTEVVQVALLSVLALREPVSQSTVAAIVLATAGVIFLSIKGASARVRSPLSWFSASALLGLASGAGFAVSAVGFRGAVLALGAFPAWLSAIYALVWAQAIQSMLVCGYLAVRDRAALARMMESWRISLVAGLAGAIASFGWFTAFALRGAADVRTLGMVEVLYGYAVSWWFFRERTSGREAIGIGLLVAGILIVASQW
jgi:drug/metabolite transporter (DMT)-like permease